MVALAIIYRRLRDGCVSGIMLHNRWPRALFKGP